jgi:hypothetical protein
MNIRIRTATITEVADMKKAATKTKTETKTKPRRTT